MEREKIRFFESKRDLEEMLEIPSKCSVREMIHSCQQLQLEMIHR